MTAIRFSRGEYWLLETVVELSMPVGVVGREDEGLEQYLNKRSHGLTRAQIVEGLWELWNRGLIEFTGRAQEAVVPPSVTAIDSFMEKSLRWSTWYRLTERGGAAWEEFARPDWNQYILEEDESGVEPKTFTCCDRKWLQRFLQGRERAAGGPPWQSVAIDECGQWNATYWKTFSRGYRASFAAPDFGQGESPEQHDAFIALCWFRSLWVRWR